MTVARAADAAFAARLRDDFDRGFALPPADEADAAGLVDLLALGCGGQRYALWLRDVAGLAVDRAITPLPGATRALLGIAGFRGAVVPVYDLGVLLAAGAGPPPRWLVTLAGAPLALAFDALVGHLRVARQAIAAHTGGAPAGSRFRDAVVSADGAIPIVHVPALIELARAGSSHEER